jgi:hypothetical protein
MQRYVHGRQQLWANDIVLSGPFDVDENYGTKYNDECGGDAEIRTWETTALGKRYCSECCCPE